MKNPYAKDGRLQNVLALIQVLAFSPKTRRTEDGLTTELKRVPDIAGSSWIDLAREHSEFFRVKDEEGKATHVSLIARNAQQSVADKDGDVSKPMLTSEIANKLMEFALELHDKEMRRKDFWRTVVIPLTVSVMAATAAVTSAVVTALYRQPLP
jgi:hypothetical protein